MSDEKFISLWVKGYQEIKKFAEQLYPDTEIISINPVGLKGVFHNMYTESYLEVHPELNRGCCEIFTPETVVENP